jgi:hypothetical protein
LHLCLACLRLSDYLLDIQETELSDALCYLSCFHTLVLSVLFHVHDFCQSCLRYYFGVFKLCGGAKQWICRRVLLFSKDPYVFPLEKKTKEGVPPMPIITPHRFRSKCTCLVEMHVFGGNARDFWNNLGIFGNKRFKVSILHTVAEWLPTKSDCRSFEEVKCRQKPTAEVLKNRISHRVSSPTYTVENGSRRIVTSLGVNMSTATRSVGGTAHERHRLQQREIDPKVVALGAAILEKIKHLEHRPPITLALIALNSALWYTPDLLLAEGSPRICPSQIVA